MATILSNYTGQDLKKEIEGIVRKYCWEYGIEYHDEISEIAFCDISYFDLTCENIEPDRFENIRKETMERLENWSKETVPFSLIGVD